MPIKLRTPKSVVMKPLTEEVVNRIKHRAMVFKVLVAHVQNEQHVILLFEDLGAAYHIRTGEELDRIIDGLQNVRDQMFGG